MTRQKQLILNERVKHLALSAMFLSLGIVLPFLTGQIPEIGQMLLPMHLPVFLCALVCGWQYGLPVAVILPLLRSLLFSRPNLYPEAIAIALEMATYALVIGLLYAHSKKTLLALMRALILSMIAGRLVRWIAQFILLRFIGLSLTPQVFLTAVILAGVPGMILQLILIPSVMLALRRTRLLPVHDRECDEEAP